jgi:hypothetical protein
VGLVTERLLLFGSASIDTALTSQVDPTCPIRGPAQLSSPARLAPRSTAAESDAPRRQN